MSKEPRSNIGYTCSDCIKKIYPRAGSFTPDEVRAASHVKANFDGEHMWLEVGVVTDQGVNGRVANDPERPESPPYDAEVFIVFSKIEDVGKF